MGTEWLKVQLQLYETCLVPSLIYGLEGWSNIKEKELSQLVIIIANETVKKYIEVK